MSRRPRWDGLIDKGKIMIRKIVLNPHIFVIHRSAAAKPENSEPHLETLPDELPPQQSKPVTRRKIRPEESLGFCNHCKEWTPLIWLPQEERGKKAESWFMCGFCSGRDITLRYLSGKEAVAKNLQYRSSSSDIRTSTRKGVQRALLSRATHP